MAKLPSAYQEVEYIQSSGTQYIDTGIKGSNTISAELVLRPNVSHISENGFFGDKWDSTAFNVLAYGSNFIINNGGNSITGPTITDMKYMIKATPTGLIVNGTTYGVNAGSSYNSYNIGLFSMLDNYGLNRKGWFKAYSFKIWNGSTLVRDFVPCYRKSDDVIGLYDTVNNTFYTNSGTGTFTKGPNVEYPPEYKLHGAIQTFHRAPKAPTSITLNESAIIFSAVGDTQQLTATISPSDASKDLIWSSNDASIATVSNTGLVTCVSLGSCVITCSAKYGSASATCDIVQVVPVTMTTTSYSQTAAYVTSSYTLFTAPSTGYYHITGTFRSNGSSGGSGCYHSLSGGTYISGTSGGKVEIYQSLVADCVYYIDAGTEFKATVQTMGYSQGGGSNFAADYYGSYDPTPDL